MIESGKSSVKKWKRTDGSGNRRNTGWKETVKWLTEAAADLVFPKRCVLCDEIIPFDRRKEGICDRCRSKIRYIREPFCMRCGRQLGKDQEEYCKDCSSREHVFLQNVTLYDYGSIADSLFRFKYRGRREYARFYGEELYRGYREWLAVRKPDALIPVPCHSSRRRQRGYNQAEILSCELGKILGIPVCRKLVKRIRYTEPQKKLDNRMRKHNLQKAFAVTRSMEGVKSVLVVDDIYTTGSTIDAVAKVLKKAGVSKVYFLTISIGQGY